MIALLKRLLYACALIAAVAAGVGAWHEREHLARQYQCYRVGAAATYPQAQALMLRFDTPQAVRSLVDKWGRGNPKFDVYLVRFAHEPSCPDAVRAALSRQVASSEPLAKRWAHLWRFRCEDPPQREYRQLAEYLTALLNSDEALPVTWRDVLDLQALFSDTGHWMLARGLTPQNWRQRFVEWQRLVGGQPALWTLNRPGRPLPDGPDDLAMALK